jgi:hypothetical protein
MASAAAAAFHRFRQVFEEHQDSYREQETVVYLTYHDGTVPKERFQRNDPCLLSPVGLRRDASETPEGPTKTFMEDMNVTHAVLCLVPDVYRTEKLRWESFEAPIPDPESIFVVCRGMGWYVLPVKNHQSFTKDQMGSLVPVAIPERECVPVELPYGPHTAIEIHFDAAPTSPFLRRNRNGVDDSLRPMLMVFYTMPKSSIHRFNGALRPSAPVAPLPIGSVLAPRLPSSSSSSSSPTNGALRVAVELAVRNQHSKCRLARSRVKKQSLTPLEFVALSVATTDRDLSYIVDALLAADWPVSDLHAFTDSLMNHDAQTGLNVTHLRQIVAKHAMHPASTATELLRSMHVLVAQSVPCGELDVHLLKPNAKADDPSAFCHVLPPDTPMGRVVAFIVARWRLRADWMTRRSHEEPVTPDMPFAPQAMWSKYPAYCDFLSYTLAMKEFLTEIARRCMVNAVLDMGRALNQRDDWVEFICHFLDSVPDDRCKSLLCHDEAAALTGWLIEWNKFALACASAEALKKRKRAPSKKKPKDGEEQQPAPKKKKTTTKENHGAANGVKRKHPDGKDAVPLCATSKKKKKEMTTEEEEKTKKKKKKKKKTTKEDDPEKPMKKKKKKNKDKDKPLAELPLGPLGIPFGTTKFDAYETAWSEIGDLVARQVSNYGDSRSDAIRGLIQQLLTETRCEHVPVNQWVKLDNGALLFHQSDADGQYRAVMIPYHPQGVTPIESTYDTIVVATTSRELIAFVEKVVIDSKVKCDVLDPMLSDP